MDIGYECADVPSFPSYCTITTMMVHSAESPVYRAANRATWHLHQDNPVSRKRRNWHICWIVICTCCCTLYAVRITPFADSCPSLYTMQCVW